MKNKIIFLLLLLLSFTTNMWAQVGIGTSSPDSNAVLELSSTTQGMKFPKMTTTERNAIASPAKGLTVFDTDLNCLMVNFGTTSSANWKCVGGVSSNHPSTNGTGIVSAYTCDTASTGTMTQGTAIGSGVTQTITATVTAIGTYNISATINGITFAGTGYFVATGNRTVLLTATGTPSLGGFHTFTLNTSPNCSFSRGVISTTSGGTSLVSSYSCTTASEGRLKKSVPVSGTGVTQTITANVTALGSYSISATANGVTFTGSGTFTSTGNQDVLLTATSGTPTNSGNHTYTLSTTPNCGFSRPTEDPSTNGTGIVSGYTCTIASSGTMTVGVTILPEHNVTQTIKGSVTTVGTYNYTTTTINGVTFSGSGTFTATGEQVVVLTATGTPITAGASNSYTLNTTPNCNFSRTIISPTSNGTGVISSFDCSTASTGSMVVGTEIPINTVSQTISVNVSAPGRYNITATSPTEPGVTFSVVNGNFSTATPQTIVLKATGTPTVVGTHTYTLNTTPNCSFTRTTGSIPGIISLATVSNTYIASVYDVDYLPYTPPTITATTATSVAADGVNETTTINIQGSIPTTGKMINLMVSASADGTLPAYTSPTITIPAEFTEDNISRDIKLSWASQSFTSTTKRIVAKIEAVGGILNLKKLDLNAGNGNDIMGVLVGTLSYVRNNNNELGTLNLRIMPGIPDKMFGVADNNASTTSHLMLYLPIEAEDGNTWLNHNLGAYYTNINQASFNPNARPTSFIDHNAYGSIFQWGRKADGHELINFTNSTTGVPVTNLFTTTLSDNPTNAKFIQSNSDWRVTRTDDLWALESSTNNPCPVGFKVPNESAIRNLKLAAGITDTSDFTDIVKLTKPGIRYNNGTGALSGTGTSNYGFYNSSTTFNELASIVNVYNGSNSPRASAFSVRCIKN